MSDTLDNSDLYRAAQDLAEAFGISADEALARLRTALSSELPPLARLRKFPWYLRPAWVPLRWKQRWDRVVSDE